MKPCRILILVFFLFAAAAAEAHSEPGLRISPYRAAARAGAGRIGLSAPALPQQEAAQPGGVIAGLKSLIFGPRVGLGANEGIPVTFVEKANVFVPLAPFQAYPVTGIRGFAASAFLGPRIGMELNERKIRTREWLGLIPVAAAGVHIAMSDQSTAAILLELTAAAVLSRLIPAVEAFSGRTMSEIERRENLRR